MSVPCENIRNKINSLEATGYKFLKHRKIIISTYNSIQNLNPIFYIKKVPKQMVEYTLLKLIDNNPELFREHIEKFNNPISSYIKYKLYDYIDLPLVGLRLYGILYIGDRLYTFKQQMNLSNTRLIYETIKFIIP